LYGGGLFEEVREMDAVHLKSGRLGGSLLSGERNSRWRGVIVVEAAIEIVVLRVNVGEIVKVRITGHGDTMLRRRLLLMASN